MSAAAQQQRAAAGAEQQEEVEHGPFPIEQLQVRTAGSSRPPPKPSSVSWPASRSPLAPEWGFVSGFSWGFRVRVTGNGGGFRRGLGFLGWGVGFLAEKSKVFCFPRLVESRP